MKYSRNVFLTLALLLALMIIASPSQATIATEITIERFVYDGQVSYDYDEYVKICNISGSSINLGGTNPWRMGDDKDASGDDEGMYESQGTLNDGDCFIIASNANAFYSIWGFLPNYEMRPTVTGWTDNASVPNLTKVGSGTWGLNNTQSTGDNITLWKYDTGTSSYEQHDEVAYGTNADRYTEVGLPSGAGDQISGCGIAAVSRNNVATDTDNMNSDFNCTTYPNAVTLRSIAARSAPAPLLAWPLAALAGASALSLGGLLWTRRRLV